MRKALFEIGAAVAAAAIGLLVLKVSDGLGPVPQWILVIGTAFIAFALASWAGRNIGPTSAHPHAEVGTQIRSDGSVTISDVQVGSAGVADTTVGKALRSKKDTKISGVRIGRNSNRK